MIGWNYGSGVIMIELKLMWTDNANLQYAKRKVQNVKCITIREKVWFKCQNNDKIDILWMKGAKYECCSICFLNFLISSWLANWIEWVLWRFENDKFNPSKICDLRSSQVNFVLVNSKRRILKKVESWTKWLQHKLMQGIPYPRVVID